MNEADLKDLKEMQAELLDVTRSPWEPRCVSRAFCSAAAEEPFVFTMQAWIDLDAMASPFLQGELPEAETALENFENAFRAFGHVDTTPEKCEGEELVLLGRKMIRTILAGFAMRVSLAAPKDGGKREQSEDSGMGFWLPVLACLISQIGLPRAEALALPVGQAFALIASHRVNQGWSVDGETYALRNCGEKEPAAAEAPQSEIPNPKSKNA